MFMSLNLFQCCLLTFRWHAVLRRLFGGNIQQNHGPQELPQFSRWCGDLQQCQEYHLCLPDWQVWSYKKKMSGGLTFWKMHLCIFLERVTGGTSIALLCYLSNSSSYTQLSISICLSTHKPLCLSWGCFLYIYIYLSCSFFMLVPDVSTRFLFLCGNT